MPKRVFSRKRVFKPKSVKKISVKQEETFWKRFDAGEGVRKRLTSDARLRAVLAVSRSTLGTVRFFKLEADFERYVQVSEEIAKAINKASPEFFEVRPVEILSIDKKNKRLLERVFISPSCLDLERKHLPSRYLERFYGRMKRKGIGIKKAKDLVKRAYPQLIDKLIDRGYSFIDYSDGNVLVLDIDKKSEKVLFGFVDMYGSVKT